MFSLKLFHFFKRKCSGTLCDNLKSFATNLPPIEPTVTILNASTKIGRNLALLLKQNPDIGELRLYDKESNVCAIAEDLSHIDTKTQIKSYGGIAVLKHAVTNSDIVVSIGGSKSASNETTKVLFDRNCDDVRIATMHMVEFNPKGIFCIARPPVEALVPLVSEEFKKAGVYDARKIFGVTTLGSMRANSIIADWAKKEPLEVLCPIVGGLSGDCLVGVISQTRPKGMQLQPGELQRLIGCAEDKSLEIYQDTESICLAPALGISRFINTLLRAIKGDTNCIECSFVRQTGYIGNFLPYMTTIVRLCRHGVLSTHMPKISGEEGEMLQRAAVWIRQLIQLGEKTATGEPQTIKEKKKQIKLKRNT